MRKIVIPLLIILSILGIGYGGYVIAHTIAFDNAEKKATQSLVLQFKENLIESNKATSTNDSTTASDDCSDNCNVSKDPINLAENVAGVITIDDLDVEAPIGIVTIYDDSKVEALLDSMVGLYEEYGRPNHQDTNTVLTAHSSIYSTGCAHCFFDNLEKVTVGSTLSILWNDGHIYTYEVFLNEKNQPTDQTWYYDAPTEGQSWITLITCTKGNTSYRTIVRARLLTID